VRRVVEAAPELGIGVITLYAFSSDNWKRPPEEVSTLMRLFSEYLRKETAECAAKGVRISLIGRRDRLPQWLLPLIAHAEKATAHCGKLHVRVAVDYSSRDAIVRAAESVRRPTREHFTRALGPDVDLLIRTAGERRLSDFLLWECAYAELYFTPTTWPDFGRADLEAALADFAGRERRFGGLPVAVA
jgi:undecaprenyl diphosphate synthase